MVAPGMSCKYTIRFAPDSLGDYEDCVTVEMQMEKLVVLIVAKRPPPVLTCESVTGLPDARFLTILHLTLTSLTRCLLKYFQCPKL